MELINEGILEYIIKKHFPLFDAMNTTETVECSTRMTTDEENILRYACSYVGMKLKQKFLRMLGEKAEKFVKCLNKMQIDGPASSFLEYTVEWATRVNRGGLFELSDDAYYLFAAIDTSISRLSDHLLRLVEKVY